MKGVEKAWRRRSAFLAIAFLMVGLTWLGGWRLAHQERSLELQRGRERMENAASLVIREGERALARVDEASGLSLEWDGGRLRRTAGAALVWTAPAAQREINAPAFAAGERMEFGLEGPERAIAEYSKLVSNPDPAVRAGALVRLGRCQRKLGRTKESLETYARLAGLGAAPVAGATAELVALRERTALLDTPAERERLRRVLESGRYEFDRATFEFYAATAPVNDAARRWAEAAAELRTRAGEFARGREVIAIRGEKYAAEWSGGRGRLTDMAAVERQLAGALQVPGLRWRLVYAGTPAEAGGLLKRPSETGLPWGVRVDLPPSQARTALCSPGSRWRRSRSW